MGVWQGGHPGLYRKAREHWGAKRIQRVVDASDHGILFQAIIGRSFETLSLFRAVPPKSRHLFHKMALARRCLTRLNPTIWCIRYGSFDAEGSPIDDGEEDFSRFLAIVILCKRPMRFHEGGPPRRQQQIGGQVCVGIPSTASNGLCELHLDKGREFVADGSGPGFQGFASRDRLHEPFTSIEKANIRSALRDNPMGKQP